MKYGDGVDVSRAGLLSERTSGDGTKTRSTECQSATLANRKLSGRKRPAQGTRNGGCGASAPQGTGERNCDDLLKTECRGLWISCSRFRSGMIPAEEVAWTAAPGRRLFQELRLLNRI
ncbi:hypothetical protein TNCV_2687201 [Trichonephila clavipes]|nr:hypothetical protein TNCV_2687201 [Trichonephila clavipes]